MRKIIDILRKEFPDAGCELRYATPFELLVAVILSAQCTDKRVNTVTTELFNHCNTPEGFAKMPQSELEKYIFTCGFYKEKAKHIIGAAAAISDKFNGEVPSDIESLLTLPGVGRKTAQVVQAVAFNIAAMPVDTHVLRVSARLGLSDGKSPDKTETDLKAKFPESEWNNVHHLLIFFGRYRCKAQRPVCTDCKLKEVCNYSKEEG